MNRGMMKKPPMGANIDHSSVDLGGTWKKLLRYCRKYWVGMIVALLCAAGGTVLSLLGPDKISELTRLISEGLMTAIDMDAVKTIGLTLAIFYLTSMVLSATQQWIMTDVTQRVSQKMREDISKKINRLPMWYYNTTSNGDILSRVTNDVDTISQSLKQSIGTLVSASTLLIGSVIMMLKTDVTLTVTAILATCIGFVLMFLIMGRSQKYFVRQQTCLGKVNGHIEEIYSARTIVKAYNAEKISREQFHELNENLRGSGFKA